MANLSDAQIKALIYNAIGRASETATIPFTKLVVSIGNSGYSIGALQTDFGANNNAGRDLIDQYQQWAPTDQRLSAAQVQAAKDIIVQKGLGNHPENRLDPLVEARINNFLASPQGIEWIAARDNAVYQGKVDNIVQPIQASQAYVALSDSAAAEMLARISKAYNQNQNVGIFLRGEFVAGRLTSDNFNSVLTARIGALQLNAKAQAALLSGQENAMFGVKLFNALTNAQGLVGADWKQILGSDPAILTGLESDARSIFFDTLFRNPVQGLKLVDQLEQGNTSKGMLMSAPKGTSTVKYVGFDKNGDLFIFCNDGSLQRNFGGTWVPAINNDERGTGVLLIPKFNTNGGVQRWVLAFSGGTELPLAEGDAQSINIDGTDVALDASYPGAYALNADGDFVRQAQQGNQWVGEVLTGDYKGQTYAYVDRNLDADGSGIRNVSFINTDSSGSVGAPANLSNDYLIIISDGKGKVTTTDVRPITQNIDGLDVVSGSDKSVTVQVAGVTVSTVSSSSSVDSITGKMVQASDETTFDLVTGAFVRRTVRSTSYDPLDLTVTSSNVAYDANGAVISRSETVHPPSGPVSTVTYDGSDNVVSVAELATYEDGSTRETVRYSDGRTVRINADENGQVTSRASIEDFEEDGSSIETVSYADGRVVKLSYDGDGNLLSQQEVHSVKSDDAFLTLGRNDNGKLTIADPVWNELKAANQDDGLTILEMDYAWRLAA